MTDYEESLTGTRLCVADHGVHSDVISGTVTSAVLRGGAIAATSVRDVHLPSSTRHRATLVLLHVPRGPAAIDWTNRRHVTETCRDRSYQTNVSL